MSEHISFSPPATDEPLDTMRQLELRFADCGLHRRFRRACYDPGDRLVLEMTGVVPAVNGRAVVEVQRRVGGGFAGQVYRVRLVELEGEPIAGLVPGDHYAVKILKPPSGFANAFRDLLYMIGYQAPFSARCLPAAARVGVLWQKLIRRAMAASSGDADAVCDTFATFYDGELASFGEINEWVEGRIWKYEVDDRLFERWLFEGEPAADHSCPEYVHKKLFMRRLVELLHDMGAPELARQYEWWSLKSQPNVLKRLAADEAPDRGLTAIDFRAGLALLPFAPMSPVDVGLIVRGLLRGRLVQFDRGDLDRLQGYVDERPDELADLQDAVDELVERDGEYRASLPDLSHHGLRPLFNRALRASIKAGVISAWRHLARVDAAGAGRLSRGRWLFPVLLVLSFVPVLGKALVRLAGHGPTRAHVAACLRSPSYLLQAMRGARLEALVRWLRAGRLTPQRAAAAADRPVRFFVERLLVSWMPAPWHRFLVDPHYAWTRVCETFSYSVSLLRDPEVREQYLLDQVEAGRREGMLSDDEADRVVAQVKDPYIQKYLRCLAVHLCTVPVTQVVMLLVGAAVAVYSVVYRGLAWPESMALATAAAALVQLMPISPGSIARGVFVLFLMVKERDLRNYYIAAPVSFLHVIGYLAFPLQMVTHNPSLARFLTARWTKSTVHIIPVFGESGGLLEHAIFDAVFNLPLSVSRGFRTHPVRWTVRVAAAGLLAAALGTGIVARLWEWRQPEARLEAATVLEVDPYTLLPRQLHRSLRGVTVRLDCLDDPVDVPARSWHAGLEVGDSVGAVVRRSFFGSGYAGLEIHRQGHESAE